MSTSVEQENFSEQNSAEPSNGQITEQLSL